MCEPFSLGAIFASVGSAFKFADLAVRVAEVGSENEVFVRTISVVRDDLNEVERLINNESVRCKITSIPGKMPWIKGAIINTKSALNEIGKWVEHARAEQESTGSIRFETRIRWVFNDHEKLLNRKTELSACHQQLSNVLSYLLRLEDIPATSEPPEYIDTTFFDDVLSRHKREAISVAPKGSPQLNQSLGLVANTARISESVMAAHCPLPLTPFAVETSRSLADISLKKAETWSEGPPCSPPPTYTSVVTSSVPSSDVLPYQSSSGASEKSSIAISRDQKSKQLFYRDDEQRQEPQRSWAYTYSDNAALVPELAGDTVLMSGTNSLGPVNPFEFSHQLSTRATPSQMKGDEPKHLFEMLGSLNFAVELPSENPGPPPGYPPRSTEMKLRNSPDVKASGEAYSNNHQASIIDRSAVLRRKPVTLHTNTYPSQSLSYSTRAVHQDPQSKTPLQVQPATDSVQLERSCFELPSSFHDPPMIPELYTGHDIHQRYSSGAALSNTVPSPLSPASSQDLQSMKEVNFGVHIHAEGTHPRCQATQLRPLDPIAGGRMRRQKNMMDLLGSLGS